MSVWLQAACQPVAKEFRKLAQLPEREADKAGSELSQPRETEVQRMLQPQWTHGVGTAVMDSIADLIRAKFVPDFNSQRVYAIHLTKGLSTLMRAHFRPVTALGFIWLCPFRVQQQGCFLAGRSECLSVNVFSGRPQPEGWRICASHLERPEQQELRAAVTSVRSGPSFCASVSLDNNGWQFLGRTVTRSTLESLAMGLFFTCYQDWLIQNSPHYFLALASSLIQFRAGLNDFVAYLFNVCSRKLSGISFQVK